MYCDLLLKCSFSFVWHSLAKRWYVAHRIDSLLKCNDGLRFFSFVFLLLRFLITHAFTLQPHTKPAQDFNYFVLNQPTTCFPQTRAHASSLMRKRGNTHRNARSSTHPFIHPPCSWKS